MSESIFGLLMKASTTIASVVRQDMSFWRRWGCSMSVMVQGLDC